MEENFVYGIKLCILYDLLQTPIVLCLPSMFIRMTATTQIITNITFILHCQIQTLPSTRFSDYPSHKTSQSVSQNLLSRINNVVLPCATNQIHLSVFSSSIDKLLVSENKSDLFFSRCIIVYQQPISLPKPQQK